MSDEVKYIMSERRMLACLDVKGPYDQVMAPGIGRLMGWADQKGVIQGPPIGIYHDSPQDVAPEELRTTIAVPVVEGAEGEGDIYVQDIEPREEALYVHKGPFENIEASYGALFGDIFKSGRKIAGPPMEIYLTDPHEVAPEELVTEIRVPVSGA